jgi:hypothetical protein
MIILSVEAILNMQISSLVKILTRYIYLELELAALVQLEQKLGLRLRLEHR